MLVPEVFEVGMNNNNPYMIMAYIDGKDGDLVDSAIHRIIWRKLGEYARKFNRINVKGFGDKMISDGVFASSWHDFVNYNITSLTADDQMTHKGIISVEESRRLKSLFERLREKNFNFGLIHHDLSLKNTRVSDDGNVYLIDWGSAQVNVVPHMDIAEILHSSLSETSEEFGLFLDGYGMTLNSYQHIKDEIKQLDLLRRTDKVRWAIDKRPDLLEQKVKGFREAFKVVFGE